MANPKRSPWQTLKGVIVLRLMRRGMKVGPARLTTFQLAVLQISEGRKQNLLIGAFGRSRTEL